MRFLFSVEKYTFKSRDSTYKGIFFISLPFTQDNVNGVQIETFARPYFLSFIILSVSEKSL